MARLNPAPGASHFGEAVQAAAEVNTERLVVAGLQRLDWDEATLKQKRKGRWRRGGLGKSVARPHDDAAGEDRRAFGHGQPERGVNP